jgi:hypothetical protein
MRCVDVDDVEEVAKRLIQLCFLDLQGGMSGTAALRSHTRAMAMAIQLLGACLLLEDSGRRPERVKRQHA